MLMHSHVFFGGAKLPASSKKHGKYVFFIPQITHLFYIKD